MTLAMEREGNFFRSIGKVQPKYKTPGNALWLHFIIMVLFVFSGSFYILTDMYIFVSWFFNLMMISGLFILRKKMPDAERPYKAFGYPILPAIYIIMALVFCVFLILIKPLYAGIGLGIVLLGIPVYYMSIAGRKND